MSLMTEFISSQDEPEAGGTLVGRRHWLSANPNIVSCWQKASTPNIFVPHIVAGETQIILADTVMAPC